MRSSNRRGDCDKKLSFTVGDSQTLIHAIGLQRLFFEVMATPYIDVLLIHNTSECQENGLLFF